MRGLREQLALVGKGVLIGFAELIPSVSGGTIALLTGVWTRAILGLSRFRWESLVMLASGEFRRFWKDHDSGFLLSIFVGSLIGLFALARFVHWLIDHQPDALMSVILGIILGSIPLLLASFAKSGVKKVWLLVFAGAMLGVAMGSLPTGDLNPPIALMFFSAIIASCAALLPGLSGAYILLVIGVYDEAVRAVSELDLKVLITLFAGVVCGVLVFSRVIRRLLDSHATATLGLMLGLVVGSLWKVFPEQINLTTIWGFAEASGLGLPVGTCVVLILLGAVAGLALARGGKAANLAVP